MLENIVKVAEANMQKVLESLRMELAKLRTGRAHPGLVESVKIDYYGNETAIKHVASIAASDARTITITPWEKNMIKTIEKALLNSGLGFNPISDANLVRVSLPQLTEERRKEMIKVVKSITETARVSVRGVRREALDKLKDLLKQKAIDEDIEHRGQDSIQKVTDKFIQELDKLAHAKEQDLMMI